MILAHASYSTGVNTCMCANVCEQLDFFWIYTVVFIHIHIEIGFVIYVLVYDIYCMTQVIKCNMFTQSFSVGDNNRKIIWYTALSFQIDNIIYLYKCTIIEQVEFLAFPWQICYPFHFWEEVWENSRNCRNFLKTRNHEGNQVKEIQQF